MKIKLLVILLFSECFVYAQSAIEGVGKFKIGQTTGLIIEELRKELKVKHIVQLTTASGEESFKNETGKIALLLPDTVNKHKGPDDASQCPECRVYLVNSYTIAGIDFKNILLFFYNDTLMRFESEGSKEIFEAVCLKYGKGHTDTTKKESNCTYKERIITTTWKSNNILCEDFLYKFFDFKCNGTSSRNFWIVDEKKQRIVRNCEQSVIYRVNERNAAEKKKKLSDF